MNEKETLQRNSRSEMLNSKQIQMSQILETQKLYKHFDGVNEVDVKIILG